MVIYFLIVDISHNQKLEYIDQEENRVDYTVRPIIRENKLRLVHVEIIKIRQQKPTYFKFIKSAR
jgi:hypothetical protein